MRGWTGSSGKSPGKDGTTKTTTLEKTLCRSTTTKTTKIPPGRSPNAEEWNETLKWLDRLVQQSTRQGRNNDNYGTHPNQNNSQKGFVKKNKATRRAAQGLTTTEAAAQDTTKGQVGIRETHTRGPEGARTKLRRTAMTIPGRGGTRQLLPTRQRRSDCLVEERRPPDSRADHRLNPSTRETKLIL